MIPGHRPRWLIAASATLLAAGALYFVASKNDPASAIKSIAITEIEHSTRTPGTSWTIDVCEFDGKTW